MTGSFLVRSGDEPDEVEVLEGEVMDDDDDEVEVLEADEGVVVPASPPPSSVAAVIEETLTPTNPDAFDGDLAALLERTRDYFRRYVVVDEPVPTIAAVWIAHTHVADVIPVTPYLHFHSPEPGSGKSVSLETLESVSRAAVSVDGITPSALFRLIDYLGTPTLLLDEVDAIFSKNPSESAEALRAILNSGYRIGRGVWRSVGVGTKFTPVRFEVFGPKALAGLKPLPASLHHRAIPVNLKPAIDSEAREDFEHDDDDRKLEAREIREAFTAWAVSAADLIADRSRKPDRHPELDARRNEISRPLFRVADLAGGRWPTDVRNGVVTLCIGEDVVAATAGRELLAAVRDAFARALLAPDRLTCKDLAEALNEAPDSAYRYWNDGDGISTRELGRKLAAYGIRARTIRAGEKRDNGYLREQFEDAWARYCPTARDEDGEVADW